MTALPIDPSGPASLASLRPRPIAAWLQGAAIVLIGLLALGFVIYPALIVGGLAPRNYNEGWNAFHTARAMAGAVLYDGNLWRIDNYPFLSFYLVGSLDRALGLGDVVLAGRLAALAALVIVAGCGGVAVRQLGGRAVDAAWGAAAVLGFYYLTAPGWVAVDDPETLGHAFMMLGLVAYLAGPYRTRNLALAALLLGLGGFTKHNLVALPLAISLDILLASRRRFLIWCGLCAAVVAALLAATYAVAGGDFLARLLVPRVYRGAYIAYHARKFLITFKLPMLAALIYLWRRLPAGQGRILRLYGGFAFASALLFAGGEGTSFNIFLDCAIWLGLASALALGELDRRLPRGLLGTALRCIAPLVLAQPILTRSPEGLAPLRHLPRQLDALHADDRRYAANAAYIGALPGPAICEDLLLCFRAGKPLVLDLFNAYELIAKGRLDEGAIIAAVAARRFGVIQMQSPIYDDPAGHPGRIAPVLLQYHRFSPALLRAIDRFYRIDGELPSTAIYRPRPAAEEPEAEAPSPPPR